LLPFLDQINDLKQLPRTGWLLAGVVQPESVAEHTLATTLLALALAETINEDWSAEGLAAPLQVALVVRIALVHDLAESSLTDLPKRSTELLGRSIKHSAEARAIRQLFDALPNGKLYVDSWDAYVADASPEARLVHDADKLEMVHQALRYEARGQRNLAEFWQGHDWHFDASRRLFAQLVAKRP
jgi:putative hydrolase of HD superfamily